VDLLFIIQIAKTVLRELRRFRYWAILIGMVAAFAVLVWGMFWQEKYKVSTTLYVDRQNIIQPLLAGQAQITRVEERRQIVRDRMLSRQLLEDVVKQGAEHFSLNNEAAIDGKIALLRKNIDIKSLSSTYIAVSYQDIDPQRSFYVISKLVDLFIKDSSENKRSESRQAFQFIDKQAEQYKQQLRDAEEKLKQFNASNTDGTSGRAQASIERIQSQIAEIELSLEQVSVRVNSLNEQINQEDRFLAKKAKASGYNERIAQAVAELDNLRLSLTDNHPDVVNLKYHIESLRAAAASDTSTDSSALSDLENPVYDELRGQLAEAKVKRSGLQTRMNALKKRLLSEMERSQRIAESNADLAELTRDYDVTKQLYEELLERKEKARLSMTLDIEGQGVSYKIQEPPKYPLAPTGLRYGHFVVIGLVVGALVPCALIIGYVLLDPRIRFISSLANGLDVPVLVEIPRLKTHHARYLENVELRNAMLVLLICVGAYVGIAALFNFSGFA